MNSQSYYSSRVFIIIIFGLSLFSPAMACRYTVREIGYSDLASTPYNLHLYVGDNVKDSLVQRFEKMAFALFLDCNISTKVYHHPKDTLHLAGVHPLGTFPEAYLENPYTGATLKLHKPFGDKGTLEETWQFLEKLALSPTRKELLSASSSQFASVLFFEGPNSRENQSYIKKIREAMDDVKEAGVSFAKPIKDPCRMITVPLSAQEEVLSWSLGVKKRPAATVIYGRLRQMGPVLEGSKITAKALFNLLSIVGADCECGLERSWILGQRLPIRWESGQQNRITQFLGLDTDNPLVISEMSQIMSIDLNSLSEKQKTFLSQDSIPTHSQTQNSSLKKSFPRSSLIYIGIVLIIIGGGIALYRKRKKEM